MSDHDDDAHGGAWWASRGGGPGSGPASAGTRTIASGSAPVAPAAGPTVTPRVPRRRGLRLGRGLAWAAVGTSLLVLVVSVGGYAYLNSFVGNLRRLPGNLPTQGEQALHGSANFLLVGSDSRAGLGRNQQAKLHVGSAGYGEHTDTMILVHLSGGDGGHATLISMPRDTLVLVPAYTDGKGRRHPPHHAKMNEAYTDGGPLLVTQVVEQETHLKIDHYVEVNFLGFVSMVDAVHGVDLCLPKALKDRDSGLDLGAGTHRVDGVTALKYVRARHVYANQDLGRIQAQQRFIAAMVRRVESLGVLANPFELKRLTDAVSRSIVTDKRFSTQNLVDLALALRNVKPEHVTFATVPIGDPNARFPGVGSVVRWDAAAADELFTKVNRDQLVTDSRSAGSVASPAQVTVQVLNAGGRPGLGAQVRAELRRDGFADAGPARSAPQPVQQTTIRYSGEPAAAKVLARAYPTAQFQQVDGLGGTVQLVLGRDFTRLTTLPRPAPRQPGTGPAPTRVPTRTAADSGCRA